MIEWLIYSAETGAELRRETATTPPTLNAGELAAEVPRSAMGLAPQTAWSAQARAFRDVPLVDGPTLLRLLTPAEIAAAVATPAVYPVVLQFLLLLTGGQPQRVTSPLHQAGAAALRDGGILTPARHAQFVLGLPPQQGDPE
jgi:hypothetical protein